MLALGCAALGAVHAWAALRSHALNLDGVSYLDMAEGLASGTGGLVNAYWSPLYPALIAIPLAIGARGPTELAWVHVLNLCIYLGCLAAFWVLWTELTVLWRAGAATAAAHAGDAPHPGAGAGLPIPDWAWHAFGALLFLWATLGLINLWAVTPDLLVCALVLLAFALLLRIRRGRSGPLAFAELGAVLGAAYWAKAALFVLAPVFLASAVLLASPRRRWRSAAVGAGVYGLCALPLVVALSDDRGRVTFGDSGALNWAWYVNRQPQRHWRGQAAAHPTRVALEDPLLYEYDRGPGGTYSPWYDPAYWLEGLSPSMDPAGAARAVSANLWHYWERMFRPLLALLAAFALLAVLARDPLGEGTPGGGRAEHAGAPRAPPPPVAAASLSPLALPATAGLILYLPVYAETRYVAPFVIAAVGVIAARAVPSGLLPRRAAAVAAAALLVPLALELGALHLQEGFPVIAGTTLEASRRAGRAAGFDAPAPVVRDPVVVARAMADAGLSRGARVAVVGAGLEESAWARLAGVRIVAEVAPADVLRFWADDAARARALSAMTAIGVDAVVAPRAPVTPAGTVAGWRDVAATGYLLHAVPVRVGRDHPSERYRHREPRPRHAPGALSDGGAP